MTCRVASWKATSGSRLQLVDQSEYNALSNGDRVRVFGYVSPDRSRLIGERIDRVDAPNVYDTYTPSQTP